MIGTQPFQFALQICHFPPVVNEGSIRLLSHIIARPDFPYLMR
jgi:hypothetical protein